MPGKRKTAEAAVLFDAPGQGTVAVETGAAASTFGNVPEYSVGELSGALKRTVEERFGYVRVRGEVSNYRGPHSSGHAYFSLKDATARIDAVVWRTAFVKMRIKPEEGMEVVASGRITTFPGKSSYQIVIDTLEPAGIGALMALLEQRRQMFASEGLFDAARKRPLPFLPGVVGVVTSPTGAVIRDILHRIVGRFPRHVVVWPVRVQGEGSAAEVAAAIRGLNLLAAGGFAPAPDVLIVARGGGSLEDLWSFNDEAVVRAAAESLIPLVSAIGHETDWTLLDHVADLRAPTPTGAAELVVPVRAELRIDLDRLAARHAAAALRMLERGVESLRSVARALPSGAELLADPRQRLDGAASQLRSEFRVAADRRRLALARLAGRLGAQSPRARFAASAERVAAMGRRLDRAAAVAAERRRQVLAAAGARLGAGFAARLVLERQTLRRDRDRLAALSTRMARAAAAARDRRRDRLTALAQLLESLGYRSVLARGFALVRDAEGHPVRRAAEVATGSVLTLDFAEGTIHAQTLDGDAEGPGRRAARPSRPRAPPRPVEARVSKQGSLF